MAQGMQLKMMRKADMVLAVTVVLVAAVAMVGQSLGRDAIAPSAVQVRVDSREFARIPLPSVTKVTAVEVPTTLGGEAVVEVASDGRARMVESDCPDQVCVRTGWITRPGQVIVCLPNRIVVRLEGSPEDVGQSSDGIDGIAY